MIRVSSLVLILALLLGGWQASPAFVQLTTESGAGLFWPSRRVTIDLQVGCPPSGTLSASPWGPCWDEVAEAAAAQWNAAGARVTFVTQPASPQGPLCQPDGLNSLLWVSTNCDEAFGPKVLAVTANWISSATGRIVESDILFDDTKPWNAYPGPNRVDRHARQFLE